MFKYRIDYAKSSKSRCRTCKKKIFGKEIRIAIVVKSNGFLQPIWHHEKCFFKKGKRLVRAGEFEKFNCLKHDDQIRIKACMVDPLEQTESQNNSESKTTLGDRELAILSQYTVEKSKTSRALCRKCELKIVQDDVRVSKIVYEEKKGEIDHWYHLACFATIRTALEFSAGGEHLPGFELLSTEDKENVKNQIKADIVDEPIMKHKVKRDAAPEPSNANNEDEIRQQSDLFHKYKEALEGLRKIDIGILCKKNAIFMPKGVDERLDLLADCMTFGVLERCPTCKGQLHLKSFYYECSGFRNEWSACSYQTTSPRRRLMIIPQELENFPAFKDYVPTIGERIFDEAPFELPSASIKRFRPTIANPPLKNMQFFVHGFKGEDKLRVKRRILRQGGLVARELLATVAAALSTHQAVKKYSRVVEKMEVAGIHVVEENFLDEIESRSDVIGVLDAIALIEKLSIVEWGTDIRARVPQEVIEGKRVKVSGNKYVLPTRDPDKTTVKVKDGLPVMESKGLEHDTHVYVEDGPYTATLNRTDLSSVQAPNLSCTIQLLEADYFKRYYVVKSTGETGQAPKVTIKYFDENVGDAKILFKEEFYKKTGNLWDKRHNFQKRYGKYDLVQLADLSNTISELRMDSQSSLPASIQQLLIMLLNINIINETIAEMDVDTSKMPLGVLADEQIASGYEALIELFIRVYKGKVNYNVIKDLSNKFYTKIPHKGSEKNLKVLDSLELIKSKLEMLVDLRSTRISYRLLQEEMDQSVNLMEGYYNRLKTQIVTLDKDSKEFNLIMEYFTNTQSETHLRSFTMFIEEIYRVEREGEMERYGPYRSLHNRKLLWHGSRLSNIAAILSEGLRIAPPEVQQTGCMFGKGIYFADVVSKSAQYIRATPDHPNGVLLLCEVALGNMKKCYTKEMITHLPEGVQSVWGVGRLQPDPARTRTLENGALVPLGNVVPNQDELSDQAKLIHNEFIVYNEAQVTIKYLLRLKFEL